MIKLNKTLFFSLLTIVMNGILIVIILIIFIKPHPSLLKATNPPHTFSLIGTEKGLYYWQEKKVSQLLKDNIFSMKKSRLGYYFLTNRGIVFSADLKNFTEKNQGIHYKTIKNYEDGKISYFKTAESLKDFSIDPYNPLNLITASQYGVYISTNGGDSWQFYNSPAHSVGIKSVAIYSFHHQLHVFFGHPYDGVYYRLLSQPKSSWQKLQAGLKQQGGYREEISDILIKKIDNNRAPEIIVSQNFTPNIYRLDLNTKTFHLLYHPNIGDKVILLESLSVTPYHNLLFLLGNKLYMAKNNTLQPIEDISHFINNIAYQYGKVQSLSVFEDQNTLYNLKELWALQKPVISEYKKKANQKQGIYMQADVINSKKRFMNSLEIIQKAHLNMITIDMKDDFGYLRFEPENKALRQMGKISNPFNIEKIVQLLHNRGIYLVARVPVFKDKVLFHYNEGIYTIKDKNNHSPWRGTKFHNGKMTLNREYWVDPYCEKVWEYNIMIAQELLNRGFDEIQFDYIRFPTDGKNLNNTNFTYQKEGMDKESAIISFLRYARQNIKGPISIDIYGANGWLRTSARTGQDVEMLAQYIDVIAPMYYPSHFAKNFLNYAPYEDRTYRIYYKGSYRNYLIGRGQVIIRPYVQSFILTFNDYDRKYYGVSYVNKEIQGIQDSINMGFTFWNSSTKYKILLDTVLTNKEKKE